MFYRGGSDMAHVKFSGKSSDAWDYITGSITLIDDAERRIRMKGLLVKFKEPFCAGTAAERHHHARIGGLALHTAEVLDWSMRLFAEFGDRMFGITAGNVYIAAVLHDLAKIHQYKLVKTESGSDSFEYNREWQFEPDIWVISEAAKFGLRLDYDEMMGIIQAHGGWSKMRTPISQLGVIIHLADMISSQFLK